MWIFWRCSYIGDIITALIDNIEKLILFKWGEESETALEELATIKTSKWQLHIRFKIEKKAFL